MESFEFEHHRLKATHRKSGIPLYTIEDCLLTQNSICQNDAFISPGIIVSQQGSSIRGTYPDGAHYFSFECDKKLSHWKINKRKLYAYDNKGVIHIFPFDFSGVSTFPLTRKPHGWCIIPNTSTILHWNVLSLQVVDLKTTKHTVLREHKSKVISGDASTSIAATGDHIGMLCIWYVASWKCHHQIITGLEPCRQVRLQHENQVAVRNDTKLEIYNVVTGQHLFHIPVRANCIEWTKYGLVVSTQQQIISYVHDIPTICFEHKNSRILKSVHDRVWIICCDELIEIKINDAIAEWPTKLIQWTEAPCFPVPSETWPKRHLDVLAISAKQWIQKCLDWDPPRIWFRHHRLREAIFDAVLHHECYSMETSWSFLINRESWYSKCEAKLNTLVLNIDFSEKTLELLQLCYKHVRSKDIYQWCWFHHGRQAMKPILMHMTKHSDFMDFIAHKPSTPDSILCFTKKAVKNALRNGWICTFINWLKKFHAHYPHAPSHHMRQIFTELLIHTTIYFDYNTIDIPLEQTGCFKPIKHITPAHKHHYIKINDEKGFIRHVKCYRDKPTEITWCPLNSSVPLTIDHTDILIWTYAHKEGPKTMLECALTLLNEDLWTYQSTSKPFTWFKSEIGAFLAENATVRIFKETMQIESATFSDNGAEFRTDTKFKVHESETVTIEWVSNSWSYIEENLYHIVPLRLKICHSLSMTTRKIDLKTSYASELLQCCGTKSIQQEYEWRIKTYATAMTSDYGRFFVGTKDGIIYEYNTLSTMERPLRTFESHQQPILQLELATRCLISLCHEEMNVWNLEDGVNIMSVDTEMTFVSIILTKMPYFLSVEQNNQRPLVTVWDIENEMPIRRLETSEYESGNIFSSSLPLPTIIVSKNMYILDKPETVKLNIDNDITCIAGNVHGICGGTNKGNIFMVHIESNELTHWSTMESYAVTAMTTVPYTKLMIAGHQNGTISVWDVEENNFSLCMSIGKSPIHCLFADSLFVVVSCNQTLKLLSVVLERATVTVHAMNAVIFWSNAWKTRLLKDTAKVLEPCVVECLLKDSATPAALALLDECTLEYQDRLTWCSPEFIDILLVAPIEHARKIVKRLAAFRGPRFDCAICGDEESNDSVVYIKNCLHRFHTECIAELIRKVPEYDKEMQYEYALHVSLTCPTCRAPFKSEDVLEDTFMNKYLHIPYKQLKNK